MTTQIPHFINGQRTTAGSTRTADVLNPSTGEVQAQVVLASAADVDAAVSGAAEAQKEWAAYNPQRRARVLMKFIELVHQNANELAELLSLEHGKTVADSHGDIQRGLEVIEFAVGIPHLLKGEFTEGAGTGIDVYSIRQPLGVVAGITPFNFPAMIPLWKAGPALACGNAFVLKPSERDPSVPLRLAELFIEAGLPAGVFQVVQGDKEAVDAILEHPEIKAVGFVGSSDIAQYIYSGAAAHGKRAQCFGGAKNHMIVMPDADLDQAVDALIGAGYGSAGERCMAISVAVPVGEETANRLRNRLVERINSCGSGTASTPRPTTARWSPVRPSSECVITSARAWRPGPSLWSTAAKGQATSSLSAMPAWRRATSSVPPCSTTSPPTCRSTPTRSSGRCCASCGRTITKRPSSCRPSMNTATASRSSPATGTRRATSCPASRSAWSRQRADPGSGGLPHLRRLEAVRVRRPQPARAALDPVLHQDQDRHRAVAVGHQGWRRVRHPDHEVAHL